MQMTILFTHTGVPLLLIPSPIYADGRKDGGSIAPGTLTMALDTGTLSVTGQPAALGNDIASAPGFFPEIVSHVRELPGVWCVAVDPTGAVLSEWPASQVGISPQALFQLFPSSGKQASPLSTGLADGLYAVASSHSWPPGTTVPPAPSVEPAAVAAYKILRRIEVRPVPPGGGFFGAVADPLESSPQQAATLSARLTAAIATLRNVVVNGQPIGDNLLGVLDWGISLTWAAINPPVGQNIVSVGPHDALPAPPPCGWDPASRTIFLAPSLPVGLDPAYLGVALYAAHVGLTGQSAVSRLCGAMVRSANSFPSFDDFSAASTAEAARAWLLLAEIARAIGPSSAETALQQLPWGPRVLSALPQASATYDEDLLRALPTISTTLASALRPALQAAHSEAAVFRETWHDPKRRITIPAPRALSATSNTASPIGGSAKLRDYVCTDYFITLDPASLPEVAYDAPTQSSVIGAVKLHLVGVAGPGSLSFAREDGFLVHLPEIPGDTITALSNARRAIIICGAEDGARSVPQTVNVTDDH